MEELAKETNEVAVTTLSFVNESTSPILSTLVGETQKAVTGGLSQDDRLGGNVEKFAKAATEESSDKFYVAATKAIAAVTRTTALVNDIAKLCDHSAFSELNMVQIKRDKIKDSLHQGAPLVVSWALADVIASWHSSLQVLRFEFSFIATSSLV